MLSYPWSSLGLYLAAPSHRPSWIRTDRLLGEHGIKQDNPLGRLDFERNLEQRRMQEDNEMELKAVRRGWCFGSKSFKQEMLEKITDKLGSNHSGELRRESAEGKAEKILGATSFTGRLRR